MLAVMQEILLVLSAGGGAGPTVGVGMEPLTSSSFPHSTRLTCLGLHFKCLAQDWTGISASQASNACDLLDLLHFRGCPVAVAKTDGMSPQVLVQ